MPKAMNGPPQHHQSHAVQHHNPECILERLNTKVRGEVPAVATDIANSYPPLLAVS
jgi:hypothetical protein